jgi:hypothetical protein
MNKFQAMAQIMSVLNEDGRLKPGTLEFRIARQIISGKIDRLGPEGALVQIKDIRAHLLFQIETMQI